MSDDATPSETPVFDQMVEDLARVEAERNLTDERLAEWLGAER